MKIKKKLYTIKRNKTERMHYLKLGMMTKNNVGSNKTGPAHITDDKVKMNKGPLAEKRLRQLAAWQEIILIF